MLIDADMAAHGEVTDSTLEAITTQGYSYRDGGSKSSRKKRRTSRSLRKHRRPPPPIMQSMRTQPAEQRK